MSIRHFAIAAFALWEAYWAYVFVSAPRPDVRMDTVFALLMGIFLPLLFAVPLWLIIAVRRASRHERTEKPE